MRRYLLLILTAAIAGVLKLFSAEMDHTLPKPDFAYPRQVSANAKTQLKQAIVNGNVNELLRAAINLQIAQSMMDKDSLVALMPEFKRISAKTTDPASKALLDILQADIYSQIYNSDRWNLDNRKLPLKPIPADFREWSGEQFRHVIDSLAESALAQRDEIARLPLRDFKSIITCKPESRPFFPSLYDFVAWQAIDLYRSGMTFFDILPLQALDARYGFPSASSPQSEAAKRISAVFLSLFDVHRQNSAPLLYARTRRIQFFHDCIYNASRQKADRKAFGMLMDLWRANASVPASAFPLLAASQFMDETERLEYYQALESYLVHHPQSDASASVKYRMQSMTSPYAEINMATNIYPAHPFEILVNSRGIKHATVNIHRLPDRISSDSYVVVDNPAQYPLAGRVELDLSSTDRFGGDTTLTASIDKPGYYFATVSTSPAIKRQSKNYRVMHCSTLALMAMQLNETGVTAIDPLSGKAAGNVGIYLRGSEKATPVKCGATDNEGYLKIAAEGSPLSRHCMIGARKGGDIYAAELNISGYRPSGRTSRNYVQVYTDLAVYHPGDTMRFAAIAYRASGTSHSPLAGLRYKSEMLDANFSPVEGAVATFTTDSYGRMDGSFAIPKGLLQGNFTLRLTPEESNEPTYTSFLVSDYKLPGFMIQCDPVATGKPSPRCATISGTVKTYSGMPLADAGIKLILSSSQMPWWFRNTAGTVFFTTDASTDSSGSFRIVIPGDILDAAPAPEGLFTATISATSSADETQETSVAFMRGSALHISNRIPTALDVSGQKCALPVEVTDTEGKKQDVRVTFSLKPIWKGGKTVNGSFMSADPMIDWKDVPSGLYNLVMSTMNSDSTVCQTTIYRPSDHGLPEGITDVLWTPEQSPLKADSLGKASILIATGAGTTEMLYIVSDSSRVLQRRWLHLSEGMHEITVEVNPETEAPLLTLYAARDMKASRISRQINIDHPERQLIIRAESFRDRIIPGSVETWRFSTVDGNGRPKRSAMILGMYNSALDAINRLSWNPRLNNTYIPSLNLDTWNPGSSMHISLHSTVRGIDDYDIGLPEFDTFGYPLYSHYGMNRIYKKALSRTTMGISIDADGGVMEEMKMEAPMAMNSIAEASVESVEAAEDEAAAGAPAGGNEPTEGSNRFAYRNGNAALAFFRPMLTTGEDGSLSFSFNVPDANTTWAFNALGFSGGELSSAAFSRSVLANKPVMVQPNLPRFLRSSDRIRVSSLVINNSEKPQTVEVTMEIFNPADSKVIHTADTTLLLNPSQNGNAVIEFQAPAQAPFIGFRVKASTGTFADGEQNLIPILPASEPLIETYPFYISPDSTSFEMKLPEVTSGTSVTLQYCDNPIWYVVTALPGLSSGDKILTANSAADSYFAAATALGLLQRYPAIGNALKQWSESDGGSSTLTSMLQQNPDLKNVLLQATPWMLEAADDTERMTRLSLLLDPDNIKSVMNSSMEFLRKTQRNGGGWSWTENYPLPSVWITSRVISRFAELRANGYLPDSEQLRTMVGNGFRYLDHECAASLKHDRNHVDISYAMLRTLWPDAPSSTASNTTVGNTVQHIVREWRHFNVSTKAEGAIILHHNGYPAVARKIMDSIYEFAVKSPEKGMYWPSAESGNELSTLFTTAMILRAMQENGAKASETDAVVQWMILQKKANNWSSQAATSVIVSSILNAGARWLTSASLPALTLDGKPLGIPAAGSDAVMGYFRMKLDEKTAGRSLLSITRPGKSPAWGAVYCRHTSSMSEIPAVDIPDLKITKTILKQEGDRWVKPVDIKVGDRLRVTLTITSGRHIEYVAVTDNRAACLEPVEQTPGPVYADGLCFYRVNGDHTTSLFIDSLPAGVHSIGYDMWVNNAGVFSSGTAAIQSQYAPQLAAHSSGTTLHVNPKE